MADVQLENGYTRIANELLESLSQVKLNGTQYAILLCVIRSTYGFQKKSHELSLNYIKKYTGRNKNHIKKELDKLIDKKVVKVYKKPTFNKSRKLGINKDYTVWQLEDSTQIEVHPSKENTHSTLIRVPHSTQIGVPKKKVYKEIYKDKDQVTLVRNLKKFQTDYFKKVLPPDKQPKFDIDSMPYKAAKYLRKLILENNSKEPVPDENPKELKDWALELDRLNRLGPVGAKNKGYNWKEIGRIMEWCQDDSFWKKNIKSASKFRKQITKLEDNMEDNAGNNNYKSKKEKSNKAVKNLYKKYEQEESKNVQKGNS